MAVLKLPVPFLSRHQEARHPKANCPTVLSSPSFAIMNTMMTGHFLHSFHNFLTFQDMKSSCQKCISQSIFSKTKLHCQHICPKDRYPPTPQMPPQTHICHFYYKSITQYAPGNQTTVHLAQVSRPLHCPFILTQMFSTLLTICFEDSHKDILLMFNASQVSSFTASSLNFYFLIRYTFLLLQLFLLLFQFFI